MKNSFIPLLSKREKGRAMREVVAMSQGDAKLQPTRASFE